MNSRIKVVRNAYGLTLEKFGNRLGVSKAAISRIERGDRSVTEQMVKSICREFGINEEWLRTGNGPMRIEYSNEERYSINVAKLQRTDDETLMRWVNAIAETNPEALKEIESFMKKLLEIDE